MTIPLTVGLSATAGDTIRVGEQVKIVWATSEYDSDDAKVTVLTLPEATRSEFVLPGVDVDEVCWVANDTSPCIMATTFDSDVLVYDEAGKQHLHLKDEVE